LHAVKEPFHVGPGAKVHLLGGAGEDAAEFADRTGWFVVAGEVGQGDVAARCQHIQILGHQAPRVAFVRHEMHHRGHQQAGRLGEVDQGQQLGVGQQVLGATQVALDHRDPACSV